MKNTISLVKKIEGINRRLETVELKIKVEYIATKTIHNKTQEKKTEKMIRT